MTDTAAARRAITQLMDNYHAAADAGRDEALVRLFSRAGVLQQEGKQWRGQNGIRTGLRQWRTRPREAGKERRTTSLSRQVVASEIVFTGCNEARGLSRFAAIGPNGVDHTGQYVDRFVRTGLGWRFDSRHVLVDSPAPEPAAARPGATRQVVRQVRLGRPRVADERVSARECGSGQGGTDPIEDALDSAGEWQDAMQGVL